jgi:hypothetical protein
VDWKIEFLSPRQWVAEDGGQRAGHGYVFRVSNTRSTNDVTVWISGTVLGELGTGSDGQHLKVGVARFFIEEQLKGGWDPAPGSEFELGEDEFRLLKFRGWSGAAAAGA